MRGYPSVKWPMIVLRYNNEELSHGTGINDPLRVQQ
jgi:hypothetical protein